MTRFGKIEKDILGFLSKAGKSTEWSIRYAIVETETDCSGIEKWKCNRLIEEKTNERESLHNPLNNLISKGLVKKGQNYYRVLNEVVRRNDYELTTLYWSKNLFITETKGQNVLS